MLCIFSVAVGKQCRPVLYQRSVDDWLAKTASHCRHAVYLPTTEWRPWNALCTRPDSRNSYSYGVKVLTFVGIFRIS